MRSKKVHRNCYIKKALGAHEILQKWYVCLHNGVSVIFFDEYIRFSLPEAKVDGIKTSKCRFNWGVLKHLEMLC